ncbi:importin-5-like isoform X1 [Babylonia areolata]|uniref:importin-5-like isoform X1 n=2 Tax=Babylonia areolata TaxID=304850 RepID=UPI003FD1E1F8
MADDLSQFQLLLVGILSTDNNVRTQSETTFEGLPVTTKLALLIQCVRNQEASLEVRTMSCILLRRMFSSGFDDVWPQLGEEVQNGLKQQLMLAIREETMPAIRKKACDTVAELARNMLDDDGTNKWQDVLKFMFELASSGDPGLMESALHIFTVFPGIFGNQQTHYLDVIKQMLGQSLQLRSAPQVVNEAVKATTAFLVNNDKESHVHHHLRDLLPAMVQGISDSIQTQDDDSVLKCLIEVAENIPKFLRPALESIFDMCLKLIPNTDLEDSWRQLGLEVIVTMSETAPAMVRKYNKYIPVLVPQILGMMVELEEEEDWAFQDEAEDEDHDNNAIAAESALDRLACALGGKTMLGQIVATISTMLGHQDWRYRHAALMAVSACGEGCHSQMELMLDEIVNAILPYLKDPHPRVRYAACNAFGQLCTDFGPNCQRKFHEKIVPGLLSVLDDDSVPRVQAHGAAALVNFSEDCPKGILVGYLATVIAKLEHVLTSKFKEHIEKGNKLVLEQVIVTLASVADTAEDRFTEYYDRFMPCLKYIIQNATRDELRLLRGKTIECISLIGLAVGREKFSQDCNEVMQLLLKTQTDQQDLADDDPQISYMISAWARMCKILGKDFQQYLPMVMGPVLKAASLKPEVAVIDSEDMKEMEDDEDWQFVTIGDQQNFGIRTAGLEEKATACQMLVCYARELKEAFAEYSEEVVKIMVPLLKFYFHDDVRIAASESLPYLLECASIRGEHYVSDMWSNYICPNLLKAIEIEPEQSVLPEHLNSFAKCVEKLGQGCLSEADMETLVTMLAKLLQKHFERQTERQEKRKDEDYDDVVEESLMEEDDEDVYILSKIADILHSFFGTHKEAFLPVYEKIMPFFIKMLSADRPWADRQWALCVWDDVLEHCGPVSANYQNYFLQSMVEYITDKQAEVRQAACYGIGVMAQFGGAVYSDICTECIPRLVSVIEHSESKQPENVNATENAISAVVKICKYNSSKVSADDLIPRLMHWLPVTEDVDEAVHIYNYVCDLLEANHPGVLGENGANLPHAFSIIASTVMQETLETTSDVYQRLLNIVRQVQTNEQMFQACLAQCSHDQQKALSDALSK